MSKYKGFKQIESIDPDTIGDVYEVDPSAITINESGTYIVNGETLDFKAGDIIKLRLTNDWRRTPIV